MTCPKCGGTILLRTKSTFGPFLGCSGYKQGCHFTVNLKGKEDLVAKWISDGNYGYSPKVPKDDADYSAGSEDSGDIQF